LFRFRKLASASAVMKSDSAPDRPGAVERAFQVADSGQVASVAEVRRTLYVEGYQYAIAGPTLSRQLIERIKRAKADGRAP
jgi:hypothetical protein